MLGGRGVLVYPFHILFCEGLHPQLFFGQIFQIGLNQGGLNGLCHQELWCLVCWFVVVGSVNQFQCPIFVVAKQNNELFCFCLFKHLWVNKGEGVPKNCFLHFIFWVLKKLWEQIFIFFLLFSLFYCKNLLIELKTSQICDCVQLRFNCILV